MTVNIYTQKAGVIAFDRNMETYKNLDIYLSTIVHLLSKNSECNNKYAIRMDIETDVLYGTRILSKSVLYGLLQLVELNGGKIGQISLTNNIDDDTWVDISKHSAINCNTIKICSTGGERKFIDSHKLRASLLKHKLCSNNKLVELRTGDIDGEKLDKLILDSLSTTSLISIASLKGKNTTYYCLEYTNGSIIYGNGKLLVQSSMQIETLRNEYKARIEESLHQIPCKVQVIIMDNLILF